jgi:hypothetical protein
MPDEEKTKSEKSRSRTIRFRWRKSTASKCGSLFSQKIELPISTLPEMIEQVSVLFTQKVPHHHIFNCPRSSE